MTNSENIKVTVVMPIYNAADYLRPALDSVTAQTLAEMEIICVDDGSTDASLDIIREFQKMDPRIRIITENNAGPSIARNKGLSRARGEYVIFLDSDDFCEPSMIEKMYAAAVKDDLDMVIARYDIYNNRTASFEKAVNCDHAEVLDGGAVVSKNSYPDVIFQCTTGYVWNKLYRHSFLRDKCLTFDPELRVFEDNYFVYTSLSLAERIGRVDEVLTHHRVYSEQAKGRLFRRYYHQVPELFARLKVFLMQHGMYIPLSQSFLNLSASRSRKIYELLWRDAKAEFWNMYNSEYAKKLGWISVDPRDIESEQVRDFVACVLLYNHKQYVKHETKGHVVRLEKVSKSLRRIEQRKKIKAFFARFVGKGKKKKDEK